VRSKDESDGAYSDTAFISTVRSNGKSYRYLDSVKATRH